MLVLMRYNGTAWNGYFESITSYLRHSAPANRSSTMLLNYITAPVVVVVVAAADDDDVVVVAIEGSFSLKCASSLNRNV